jgi:hypothetical protein
MRVKPVILRPGRARLTAKPRSTGFINAGPTIGTWPLGSVAAGTPSVTMTSTGMFTSSAAKLQPTRKITLGEAKFEDEVAAFDVAEIAEPRSEPV